MENTETQSELVDFRKELQISVMPALVFLTLLAGILLLFTSNMNQVAPNRALLPALFRRPPITKVGSSPPSASTLATRLVVVVLPCVPATAMA